MSLVHKKDERNRRVPSHRSSLALIPLERLFSSNDVFLLYCTHSQPSCKHPTDDPFDHVLEHPLAVTLPQRRPGPDNPRWKIPPTEWPNVLRRVELQHESLRQVARDYGVSYEAVRRVLRAARKEGTNVREP